LEEAKKAAILEKRNKAANLPNLLTKEEVRLRVYYN